MIKILTYHEINQQQWQKLIERSPYATWFQTPEAYDLYNSVPGLKAFAYGVRRDDDLQIVAVGYITQEKNPIKQFFTSRAIIIGGPVIDQNAYPTCITALFQELNQELKEAIYVETRNFSDYSPWRENIEFGSGFRYQPHLNFHVDTSSQEIVDHNLSESRKRDIRTTIREGVTPVYKPTIEQVRAYYEILKDLYKTKVKTPLFEWEFFEKLYRVEHAHYILTEYHGHIIGGTIVMELPNKAMYEWYECGLDGVGEHIYPSTYATYLGLTYAAEHGCPRFDMMGAGKPNVPYGVRDFKAKFGGELVEHGRYLCVCKPMLYKIGKLGVKYLKRK